MDNKDLGARPADQALAVPATPASGRDASRFDPSRDDALKRVVQPIVEGQIRSFIADHPKVLDAVIWYKRRDDKATTLVNSIAKRIVRDLLCSETRVRLMAALVEGATADAAGIRPVSTQRDERAGGGMRTAPGVTASGIEARSDETLAAQPEGQEPVPSGDAQNLSSPSCLGVVEALERIEALDEEELWGFPDRCTGDRPSFKTLDADTVKSIARTALQSHRGDER